jgi:hypothetical protein
MRLYGIARRMNKETNEKTMAFKNPKPGPGRPKGSRNKTKLEISDIARQLLESREYRTSLRRRIIDGKSPMIEQLLYYYAYGRPLEKIQIIGPVVTEVQRLAALYDMTTEEVLAEAQAIAEGRDR